MQDAAAPGGHAIQLPDPSVFLLARASAGAEDTPVCSGAEFARDLPANRVEPQATLALFTPEYDRTDRASPAEVAYACYVFGLEGYELDPSVRLIWHTPPDDADLWIGLGNINRGSWDWFPGPASDTLAFSSFNDYTSIAIDYHMVIAIAVTGAQPALLRELSIGGGILPDTIFAVPAKTLVDYGESVRVTVYAYQTASAFKYLNSVCLAFLDGNEYTEGSFNVGAPGGESFYPDGVWTEIAPTGFFETLNVTEHERPGEYDRLAFNLTPLDGNEVSEATGALFNFELTVKRTTPISIVRHEDILRTYYSGEDSAEHTWTNDTNDGQPGIRIREGPTAVLTADVTEGDTPLLVQFDASGSTDPPPGQIVKFEFDFGEGGGFQDNGTLPFAQHTYTTHGEHSARLRVTDDSGHTDMTSVLLYSKRYDEVEDNDTIEQANMLPAFSFQGFRGRIAEDKPAGTYGIDLEDYYKLQLPEETSYRIFLDMEESPKHDSYYLDLLIDNGRWSRESSDSWDPRDEDRYVDYFMPAGGGPVYLKLRGYAARDYQLFGMREPPIAGLKPERHSGELPFIALFDARGSSDSDGGSLRFEFDFDEGAGFEDCGSQGLVSHTYQSTGLYYPRVRVVDPDGNFGMAGAWVYAGGEYDEVEPNNGRLEANPIVLPVGDLRGNLGFCSSDGTGDPPYLGYDGSNVDYYSFSAFPGQTVTASIDFDSSTGSLGLHLVWDWYTLESSGGPGNHQSITHVFGPEESGEFNLLVIMQGQGPGIRYSDYVLNAAWGGP